MGDPGKDGNIEEENSLDGLKGDTHSEDHSLATICWEYKVGTWRQRN